MARSPHPSANLSSLDEAASSLAAVEAPPPDSLSRGPGGPALLLMFMANTCALLLVSLLLTPALPRAPHHYHQKQTPLRP